jgi:hypothetical protein
MSGMVPCPGCGAMFPDIQGATHRYLKSSPGCWAAYGDVLAREYSDPVLFGQVHRLTVDAYAVQHPGEPATQSVQSVALHLVSLCLILEHGATLSEATASLQKGAHATSRYVWLPPPEFPGAMTVADVQQAKTPQAHQELVRNWAAAVWSAWKPHHEIVRTWVSSGQP